MFIVLFQFHMRYPDIVLCWYIKVKTDFDLFKYIGILTLYHLIKCTVISCKICRHSTIP